MQELTKGNISWQLALQLTLRKLLEIEYKNPVKENGAILIPPDSLERSEEQCQLVYEIIS